jgi:hypothetical protein
VRYWRKRWRQAAEGHAVPERLAGAPRSGAPATFTPEQICALVAMTCEKPSESERPISHWSQREIADEAIRRGLVPADLKPHRVRYWLTPKPDPAFDAKCADICGISSKRSAFATKRRKEIEEGN